MHNYIYIMEFDMLSPMPSNRGAPKQLPVTSKMIKVGKVSRGKRFEGRMGDYAKTYRCDACDKSHASIVNYWELSEDIDPSEIERFVKAAFKGDRVTSRHEYYWATAKPAINARLRDRLGHPKLQTADSS